MFHEDAVEVGILILYVPVLIYFFRRFTQCLKNQTCCFMAT